MKTALTFCLFLLVNISLNAQNQHIKVGAIYNLTGAQSSIDHPALNGFNLAFDQVLRSQNALLNQLQKEIIDGKTDTDVLLHSANRSYQDKSLIALIGINDDDMARSVSIEARKMKKIFISSGATSPLLTKEFPFYTFLVAFGDNAQAAAVAEYASKTLNFKTCCVLHNADMQYARLIANYFSTSFTKMGGTIVGKDTFSDRITDFSEQIKKIKIANPEMIYLAAGPEQINTLIELIRDSGITAPIFGGDSYDTPLLSDRLSGVYFSTHVLLDRNSSDPEVVKFMKDYQEKFGTEPTSSFAALGYDACTLFASAIAQANSIHIEELLKSLNQIHFKGVTGEISYVDGNHTPIKPVTIVSLNKGKKEEIARFVPQYIPPAE